MSNLSTYAVSDHWDGSFEDAGFEAWAQALRKRLVADQVDLAFVFATPEYEPYFADILEIVQIHCQAPHVVGGTGNSLVSQGFEYEHSEGVSVSLHRLPGGTVDSFELAASEDGSFPDFDDERVLKELEEKAPNGFVVFADPFSTHPENILVEFNRRFPGIPVMGGLACGTREVSKTTLFLNHRPINRGAVGVAIGGEVIIESLISQGCQPVGDSFIITSAEKNILEGIANRKAYEVLSDVFDELPDAMKLKSRGNLHVGFVINEYQQEFDRGDFLVRNLIGADPKRGALLVGALPRVGQTLQFQLRDRHSAMEDMNDQLEKMAHSLTGRKLYGGLLATCTGRGKQFFKVPDFDAGSIQDHLGPVGVSGFFGNGEFGPVGGVNFVHGYTAALSVFTNKPLDVKREKPL